MSRTDRPIPPTALVIPCFNETDRIDWGQIENADRSLYFLFVDDGSNDGTPEEIKKHASPHVHLLPLPRNGGKAHAVYEGMNHLRTLPFYDHLEWAGYWDADFATPLAEIPHFFAFADLTERDVDAVLGSRVYRLGSEVTRSYLRHIMGRLFMTYASYQLSIRSYDSQCGAKLFKTPLLDKAFGEPFISRWLFDLEIIIRLEDSNLVEYPLQHWRDVAGSKLNIAGEWLSIIGDIHRIKERYRR